MPVDLLADFVVPVNVGAFEDVFGGRKSRETNKDRNRNILHRHRLLINIIQKLPAYITDKP
jgi:hypothetical protein